MEKVDQRKKYRNIRKNITDKETKSNNIVDSILSSPIYKSSKVIALYSPLKNEVDITRLITESLNRRKIVLLPRVIDEKKMEFVQIISFSDLKPTGRFNLKEPLRGKVFLPNQIDLMIIPGICFDTRGFRIGYGQGYYDYYLNGYSNIYKIGVCFKECLSSNNIQTNEFDVKMNLVIFN